MFMLGLLRSALRDQSHGMVWEMSPPLGNVEIQRPEQGLEQKAEAGRPGPAFPSEIGCGGQI